MTFTLGWAVPTLDRGKFQTLLQTRIALVHCVGQPRGSPESFPDMAKTGGGVRCEEGSERKKKVTARGSAWSYRDLFTWRCKPQIKALQWIHSGSCLLHPL